MKVLLSAYACEPHKGSEPEVGLQTALAAAREHDVWVLTRANNLPSLEAFLGERGAGRRIRLVGLDLGRPWIQMKKRNRVTAEIYYDRWQRAAGRLARELDREHEFDVVHHVTFAAYRKRAGVALLDRPLVWGPVGGGAQIPLKFLPHLGARGLVDEIVRTMTMSMTQLLPSIRHARRRTTVVLTQNHETANRLARTSRDVRVLPNALVVGSRGHPSSDQRRREAVVVARLIPWKGTQFALRAFAEAAVHGATLTVVGDGPELEGLRRLARDLGISEHTAFVGHRAREDVLNIVAKAAVLVHPALREEAGLAVAEALANGTPVVCLDRGGPPELVRCWPGAPATVVAADSPRQAVADMAEAVRMYLEHPLTGDERAGQTQCPYADQILDAYRTAADRTTRERKASMISTWSRRSSVGRRRSTQARTDLLAHGDTAGMCEGTTSATA